MTTEPTQPQPEQGPTPDNGQVQSQGHRRRRRRRKNKSSQQGAMQPPQAQGQPQPQMQGQPQAPPQIACFAAASAATPGPKEKVLPEELAPQRSPATASTDRRTSAEAGKRARAMFVGPMDHSYRVVNGNVADGPASTIPTAGNGHSSGYYPEVYAGQAPAPLRENAPTRIFCFIEDLFFLAKIRRPRANSA